MDPVVVVPPETQVISVLVTVKVIAAGCVMVIVVVLTQLLASVTLIV